MEPLAILFVIGALAAVIVKAAGRGKREVGNWYRRRIHQWRGSRPDPAPAGVKVGAAAATAVVATVLWTRGFWRGLREGVPQGVKAGRDRYEAYLADRAAKAAKKAEKRAAIPDHRCPTCRYDLAGNGWPREHKNRYGRPCSYDWATDPKWQKCDTCGDVLIPGEATCTRCAKTPTKNPAPAAKPSTETQPVCAHGVCTNPADVAGGSIYCPTHTQKTQPRPLRLVKTEGDDMAIDTVTGGDVHNLSQIDEELNAIRREAVGELEDAIAEQRRAEEDAARYERFEQSLRELEFSDDIVGAVAAMRETANGRVAAARDRAVQADKLVSLVNEAQQKLAPHMTIREAAQAAGGVAKPEAYAG